MSPIKTNFLTRRIPMTNTTLFSNQYRSRTAMTLLLALTTMMLAMVASAAPPVGQTIWIKASATNRFVSADQNRGAFAPLVADRTTVGGWEQFQVIDVGGGFIALKSIGTGKFVSADLNRGTFAPFVADRASASTWEHFTWADLAGGAFTLKGRVTGKFVSADLNRGTFAPLVSDRTSASTWETFTWAAVGGTPPPPPPPTGAPPGFPTLLWSDEFNGTTINGANWTYDLGNGGVGNKKVGKYKKSPGNARSEDGKVGMEDRPGKLGGRGGKAAPRQKQRRATLLVYT